MNRETVINKAIKEAVMVAGELSNREHSLIKGSVIDVCIEFEKKTCETCICVDTTDELFERKCKLLCIPCPDGFGCNRWEQKD